jgi:NADPH-dependent 2,4-dienoyl-CoA reductase/sulfur reductase-like enzyme
MPRRLVVIGGDAGGMSAASQARRLDSDLEIVALERGNWTSYSACGIPYLVGGEVSDIDDLVARTPEAHRARRIDVRLHQEAVGLDLDKREVEVRDHAHDRTYRLGFDDVLVATGARPLRPDLPGLDSGMVHGVQTLDDAAGLLEHAERIQPERVVVVGGGYIGLEMAEAFVRRGATVTLVEAMPSVMRTLDPDLGDLVRAAMERFGIDVRTGVAVEGFEPGHVHTAAGRLDADLVVLGLGVVPNSELAGDAGIELGARNAIAVDQRQRTSADGVWAAGDCCTSYHLVSQRQVHIALGTVANKHGRVAGTNLGGGYARFPGVVGTAATKVCSTEIARTGLTQAEASRSGFAFEVATVETSTRAGYLPDAKKLTVRVLAERGSGRLLGAQIVGEENAAKRIDVFATALTNRMTVQEMVNLDLSYAPPFSPLWDAALIAARKAAEAVGTG